MSCINLYQTRAETSDINNYELVIPPHYPKPKNIHHDRNSIDRADGYYLSPIRFQTDDDEGRHVEMKITTEVSKDP